MTATASRPGLPLPITLSCDPAKREYYGADVYYLESAEQLDGMLAAGGPGQRGTGLADFAYGHALLLLKPDAVVARQVLPAIDWLRDNGFRIVAANRSRVTRTAIRALWQYQWNLATRHRRRLADGFVTSADSLVLVVRPDSEPEVPASVLLTELKGPTSPDARQPGQLRYLLGRYCYLLNLVHTADEPADVLRELAVYFGTRDRAAVYADALSGLDQRDRAIQLARELYAEAPQRELDFRPAAERLAAAAAELLAAGGLTGPLPGRMRAALAECTAEPKTWRPLLELIWGHDLVFDTWDLTTVGSYAFPMKRTGFAPILGEVSRADWRRHLADGLEVDSPPAAPGPGSGVEFARTVARDSVHRRAVSEVFLTSAVQVDEATFDLGTQIPRQHGYFSDHLSCVAYDPMFFVEACRQGVYVLAHTFLSAPQDHHFILRGVQLDVTEPELLTKRDAPTEARIRCHLERRYRDRRGHDAGFRMRYRAHIDEREALSCLMDVRWVSPEQWAAIRGADRADLGLAATPAPCPRSPRLPAHVIGRRDPGNVMISPLNPSSYPGPADRPDPDMVPAWAAVIVVDTGHPALFDHPLDHIPGMLQLEAMRQLATAAAGPACEVPASSVRLSGFDVRFSHSGELDLPACCVSSPSAGGHDDSSGSDLTFRCAVRQADVTIAEGWVRLSPAPRLATAAETMTDSTDLVTIT